MTIDIYPKSRTSSLDIELFKNPTNEYRGTPFWSWNNKLDLAQLKRQIDWLGEMGFGGYHVHSRTGMGTAYMGPEFLSIVKAVTEYGKSRDMLTWLYDEDRWPSGAAGGLVTKNHTHRAKHLLFTPRAYGSGQGRASGYSSAAGHRQENGVLVARYDVQLKDGLLAGYRVLQDGEAPAGQVWHAYLETAGDDKWYNGQAYVDTLSREAIQKFIELTHEPYYKLLSKDFGGCVPAIFTDEPQFPHKQSFSASSDLRDVTIPWTTDFAASFEKMYGERIEEKLPEIFWELPDHKPSLARYRYHDHVAERFAEAFADTVGNWCKAHGIALTGHMMEEPTLQSQTAALGEAMRSYRSFQLPGIDMLCDWREYTTAKQAQSAAHQYGYPGVLSELYGVTNWDFDFVGHKEQGDWQAALGVTVRVPHLSWVSMAGEAKRDYPASISYQSPWFREYKFIEDHFARVATVLTRGTPGVRVGVIHPVESYWLCFGPLEQTKAEREEREADFGNITKWLLHGLIDFNFICESLLPTQINSSHRAPRATSNTRPTLAVGQMNYEVILVPGLRTIRATTLDRLEKFVDAGGAVLFVGEVPTLVDARPSDRAERLASRAKRLANARPGVIAALDTYRDIDVRSWYDGAPVDSLLHQLRLDGDRRHLFLTNTDRGAGRRTRIKCRGEWAITQLDTFTGASQAISSQQADGWTTFEWHFDGAASLLVTLSPGKSEAQPLPPPLTFTEISRLPSPVPITLSEPNVLLLDQAQWRINDDPWQPLEEVLRLENFARAKLGLDAKSGHIVQPWADQEPIKTLGRVSLKFVIHTDVPLTGASLAVEDAKDWSIELDGQRVPSAITGWWTDEAIHTVSLPHLSAGSHELVISIDYSRKTNIEWCYLLGDFGVEVRGRDARLIPPVRTLAFGDWTNQGLPFYGGNVTYHATCHGAGGSNAIAIPNFSAPLLSVDFDGKPAGKIAFDPYRVDLGPVAPGQHAVDITAFGNRANCFGQVHNCANPLFYKWWGPESWRTTGELWAYEYQLRPMGILVAPQVLEY